MHGSTVLYPCDANQAARLTAAMADLPGISYLRTTRGKTPVIYRSDQQFPVGGSYMLRSSPSDQVTIVATGITVHEALTAADTLADQGIAARIIDAYSVKPIDAATLRHAAHETGRLVTAEDHWAEGGLGDAVLDALAAGGLPLPPVIKLAVHSMPPPPNQPNSSPPPASTPRRSVTPPPASSTAAATPGAKVARP